MRRGEKMMILTLDPPPSKNSTLGFPFLCGLQARQGLLLVWWCRSSRGFAHLRFFFPSGNSCPSEGVVTFQGFCPLWRLTLCFKFAQGRMYTHLVASAHLEAPQSFWGLLHVWGFLFARVSAPYGAYLQACFKSGAPAHLVLISIQRLLSCLCPAGGFFLGWCLWVGCFGLAWGKVLPV